MIEYWASEAMRLLFQVLPVAYVVRSWMKWSKAGEDRKDKRGRIALVGFAAVNVAVALSAFGFVYSWIVDIGFYNPVEMFCIGVGLLASLFGLMCSAAGKGLLRLPTGILSAFMGLLFLGAAAAQ